MGSIVPITTVEVPMSVNNSWTEVNAYGYGIPLGATGLIIHVHKNKETLIDHSFGLRKKGSTNNITAGIEDSSQSSKHTPHFWAFVGLDSALKFEYYVGDYSGVDLYITAYTTDGVTFLTTKVDKSFATEDAWTDINCSANCPDAIAVIVEGTSIWQYGAAGNECIWAVRKKGSTDTYAENDSQRYHGWAIIGCDDAQKIQAYQRDDSTQFYIIGYITSGVTVNTNGINFIGGSNDAWATKDLETELPSAYFAIIQFNGSTNYIGFGIRKYGETGDDKDIITAGAESSPWIGVALDRQHRIEIYEAITDFYIIAYCDAELATIQTVDSSGVTSTGATLIGFLEDDGGVECTIDFEYGETDSYGSNTSDTTGQRTGDTIQTAITGLTPDTTYHFRARAVNQAGTSYGDDMTFTTGAYGGVGYPSDTMARVAGLVHRWQPGDYSLEVYIGGLSSLFNLGVTEAAPTIPETPATQHVGLFTQAQYEAWLRATDLDTILEIFGHFPTFTEWTKWYAMSWVVRGIV